MTMASGGRIAEHLSVGVLAQVYPWAEVENAVAATGTGSRRVRDLPAEVVAYYVMAMGLFMAVSTREVLRVLVEGLRWMGVPRGGEPSVRIAGKAAISQARLKLGEAPLKRLWEQTSKPLAQPQTRGAYYRGLLKVALDGTTLDVPDTVANRAYFGKPGASRGRSAFPQARLLGLMEVGAHGLLAAEIGRYQDSEHTLALKVAPQLTTGMLCLADRYFGSYALWKLASQNGAHLLWRVRSNMRLPVQEALPDGSYLSSFHPSTADQRRGTNALRVRVVEYSLEGHSEAVTYRLMTTLLDPEQAPARELAELYLERWEVEGVFDELKTHLRGGQVVLRSKTPSLVHQEIYGLLLAHRAVRTLMCRAANGLQIDPDRLSFTHSLRVVRRRLAQPPAFSP
jgi:hypothetical protein